ncbi:hypothetical protein CGC20_0970 [Leishmania donovani]|uniref:Surface antigen protein 2 n=1 Tax=Leishmania donovani TaxID=5661 RepID=A0A504XW82_LEIDO|nr:hypothetical protein CGC20_0970 [Leishmania donovani]
MALCVRRLVLAATLAAAVALLLCTSSAPVVRAAGTAEFTETQKSNTLKVLQAFARAIPELGKKWTGDDFCWWGFVMCVSSGVSVSVQLSSAAGTLPEMPDSVDYTNVIITGLRFFLMPELVGTLPASWSRLQGLTSLTFWGCGVSGTLPPSWRSMKSLTSVWIQDCRSITGTLPPEWASMPLLTTLRLRYLPLRSTLPTQWSSMTSLTILSLDSTQVYGTLPPGWSGMSNAWLLQLENCDLSGSLPSSWSAMPKLEKVSLRGNHFCGCVPDSWAQNAGLDVSIEDKHKGSNCIAETECGVDGCEVCEGDSAARCARCGEGYFLTDERTCLVYCDGGVAAVEDSTDMSSCALCCEALVSVPSLPCRRNRAATTAVTLPRRTVPPDADAGVEAYRHHVARRADIGGGCASARSRRTSAHRTALSEHGVRQPSSRGDRCRPAVCDARDRTARDPVQAPAFGHASATSCRDAEACATTGDADALLLPAPRLGRPAVGWAPLPWRRAMGAGVVRLPHPRHGRALLCFVVRDPVACTEVRAHAPPSGFAQRCDRLARTFMSAADLYRDGDAPLSAGASASAAGCEAAAPWANACVFALGGVCGGGEDWRSPRSACARLTAELSAWSGADGTHVGCGGPHGWTADPRSRPAASSMCSATPHGWAGWARAAAARPLLLRGCVGVPESDGVLRRLCEAREVGGSVSAQTASCDAPADSRHAAHHRPSESVAYVPVRLHAALAVACGLADPAAAPACSPTAAA